MKSARKQKKRTTLTEATQDLAGDPNSSWRAPVFGKLQMELAFAQVASLRLNSRSELSELLDKYLDDPRVQVTSYEDVLAWWKRNSDAYPIVSLVDQDFFSLLRICF